MLNENAENNNKIIDAITWFHRNGTLPKIPPLDLEIQNLNELMIKYGCYGKVSGSITIKKGQFTVTKVSENGNQVPLPNYQHSADKIDKFADYISALLNPNLKENPKHTSALIILTAESCRSQMVSSAINKLLDTQADFSTEQWNALSWAFTTYEHVAKFKKYKIEAGKSPWTWLTYDDYLGYVNSTSFSGDKDEKRKELKSLKNYINNPY